MKLSDVKGERTLDVIAACIGPVCNIGADPQAAKLFRRKALPKGMTPMQFMAKRMADGLPALCRGHKSDIIAILAAVQGVAPEEYARELDLKKLFSDLAELLTDQEFGGFFLAGADGGSETLWRCLGEYRGPGGITAFLGYALACWQEQARRRAWQAYMAEALRLAGENAARLGGGPYLQTRWTDLLENKPEETRTPQQVKAHMLQRLRGMG